MKIELDDVERATIARLCNWAERQSSSSDEVAVEAHKALLQKIAGKMRPKLVKLVKA